MIFSDVFLKYRNIGALLCVFVIKSYGKFAENKPQHFVIDCVYFLYYFLLNIPITSTKGCDGKKIMPNSD